MPSACIKSDNKASSEAPNQFQQCISFVEKKVRNLEKRKVKLDTYINKKDSGSELNQDQEEAIAKYDGVIQNLDFAKDLTKNFLQLSNDLEKFLKRKEKRDQKERQANEIVRMRDILKLQELLSNMGSEEVREDFKAGKHGAIELSEKDLEHLDELYKIITPSREGEISYADQLNSASEHMVNLQDGREKEVIGSTYKDLKEMVDKIHSCGYFDNIGKHTEQPEVEEVKEENPTQSPEPETEQIECPEPVVPEPAAPIIHQETVPEPIHTLPTPVTTAPVHIPQVHLPTQQVTVEPVAAYGVEDDSFFSTNLAARQPRGFQEIVSSVQGSFNFLQESEIDVDLLGENVARSMMLRSYHDAALQQAGYQLTEDQTGSAAANFGQHVVRQPSQNIVNHHAAAQPGSLPHTDALDLGAASTPESVTQSNLTSQIQFGAVDGMGLDSQIATTQALEEYDQTYGQNIISQTLGGSTSSHVSSYGDQNTLMSSNMTNLQEGSASSSGAVPPPIPMPDEIMPGQSLINQGYGATDSENSQNQEKKSFSMNPNADPFQSNTMFSQSAVSTISPSTASLSQTTSSSAMGQSQGQEQSQSSEERKPAWQTNVTQSQPQQNSTEYNKGFPADGFSNTTNYNRNAASRGSRGNTRGGGNNRGMNNGFTRGGNRGGNNYNNNSANRNTYNTRGSTRGMRGGAQRGSGGGGGGGMRGGRGAGSSYQRNQPYSQQE